ncbi:family 78 glycoside hydrolase catalytic domain [Pedobacter aquatilis]|uniref:family 78 glycoside hydrolase catalytic domain n=1 Tax=Pedobacter aquatilis TaxID=351343 RepID=UPI00292FB7E9|nr:family 78 glycoside hydrolase catalytic domain [Pedobacter aquatilis]
MNIKYLRIIFILSLLLITSAALQAQDFPSSAKWICRNEDKADTQAPFFRKSFSSSKSVKTAILKISGLGFYDLSLNGKTLNQTTIEQGITKYDSRILFQTYDVTKAIQKGHNAIAVELGNGWYNMQSLTIWNFDKISWRKSPRLLLSLEIEYSNGEKHNISTDESWKTNTGPSRFNSMHVGEIYDARKELPGWNKPAYDDNSWQNAKLAINPGGKLEENSQPNVAVIKTIKPKSLKALSSQQYIFDMGENFSGVPRIKVRGKAGDTVKITSDELLNSDGTLNTVQNSGQMIGEPSDPGFQTDIYILKGKGEETFTPRFSYHGFQYVELAVSKGIKITKNSLQGLFYSTDFRPVGSFKSSDEMLNKLYAAAIQSYRSNFIGIPTDCPQREKMGWLADAHFGAELGLWNFDSYSGYRAYLRDIRDVQNSEGKLPGIAPTSGIGFSWIDPEDRDFGPNWGSALPLITWSAYRREGDIKLLKENYPAIKSYLEYLIQRAEKTGSLYTTGIADWQAIEQTPKTFTSTAMYYQNLLIAEKIANLVGAQTDATRFNQLAKKTKNAFNNTFFSNAESGYKIKTVTALSAALYYKLYPKGAEKTIASDLYELIKKKQYKIDFGIFGTKYVLRALSDNGYVNTAYKLLTNSKSGWAEWIAGGSTTLWEEWPGTTSRNHVYSGDYAAWFFEYLGGIKIADHKPGFSQFNIQPVFPEDLKEITVEHKVKQGTIKVHWKRADNKIIVDINIPENTTASFINEGTRPLKTGLNRIIISKR